MVTPIEQYKTLRDECEAHGEGPLVEIYDYAAQLKEEVDLWRERTSIERGEWSICIPHNSAYKTDEGCIRCENDGLKAKLEAIECGECEKSLLECACEESE